MPTVRRNLLRGPVAPGSLPPAEFKGDRKRGVRRAQRVTLVELSADTTRERTSDVGPTCHSQAMNRIAWRRPASEPDGGWAVVDVETSGFRPGQARIISVAALGLDGAGRVEQSVVSLLNPGVDPGPTHVS